MPKTETQLVTEAKRVARLSRRATTLRRDLKNTEAELRHARRMLKKLASAACVSPDPFEQTPPLRTFGEAIAGVRK